MNAAFSLALASLKKQKRSTALLFGTVFLSVVFLVCMCLAGSSAVHTAEISRTNLYGEQKLALWSVSEEDLNSVEADPFWSHIGKIRISASFEGSDGKLLSVGTADESAFSLARLSLSEGRLPQSPDEAVFESGIHRYLGLDGISVGDTVTLSVITAGASEPFGVSFKVCGIIDSYSAVWNNSLNSDGNQAYIIPPSVFVTPEGAESLSPATIDTLLLLNVEEDDFFELGAHIPDTASYNYNTDTYPNGFDTGSPQVSEETLLTVSSVAVIAAIILVCTMTITLNGFLMSVDRRKQQLSLLRCIGATRRQAMNVIVTEALLLLAAGVPAGLGFGVLASVFAVRLFALISGAELIWHFSGFSLPLAAVLCVFCVLLSTIVPAARASKQSPIVGSRPVFFCPRRRRRRAGRAVGTLGMTLISIRRSWAKTVLTGLTFALVIIVSGAAALVSLMFDDMGNSTPDVKISSQSTSFSYSSEETEMRKAPFFVNYEALTSYSGVPTDLPPNANSELPLACSWSYVEPRFAVSVSKDSFDEYLNGWFVYESEALPGFAQGELPDGISGITGEIPGSYPHLSSQRKYGIGEDEYLLNTYVFSVSDELLIRLSANVVDGKIDIDAINRGEEVVLTLPNYKANYDNYPYGDSQRILGRNTDTDEIHGTVFKNQNWNAGDTITLTWVNIALDGTESLIQKEVRIGATVMDGLDAYDMPGQVFGLYVGAETLNALSAPHSVRNMSLYFPPNANIRENEELVCSWLDENYPSLRVTLETEVNMAEQQLKQLILGIIGMVIACLTSLGLLGLVNTASVRINSRSHQIGLLRCVGMTKGQTILMLTGEGILLGAAASAIGCAVCRVIFPLITENWRYPSLGITLAAASAASIALSVLTIFLPASKILKKSPTEITRTVE